MASQNELDIGIVTINTEFELRAVLKVFGLSSDDYQRIEPERYWFTNLFSKKLNRKLKIALTCVGTQGNPSATASTTTLIQFFNPALLILIGTAAGIKKKVSLLDVVISEKIIGYEYVRRTLEGDMPRHHIKIPPLSILQDILHFDPKKTEYEWANSFKNLLDISTKKIPMSHIGSIASGEKLIVNGSLIKIREKTDEKLIAGEMEGYGFAVSADRAEIPWVVIRGVSDYGEPKSKDGEDKDKFHYPASITAASYVKTFLMHGYSGKKRISDIKKVSGTEETLLSQLEPLEIKTVLFSTYNKERLKEMVQFLVKKGVKIIASPGTASLILTYISELNTYPTQVQTALEYTKSKPVAGVRGTLHPYIMAGLKANKDDKEVMRQLGKLKIQKIDLVFVNTPELNVTDNKTLNELLDLITEVQTGGPTLLRWIIRQWRSSAAVVNPSDYSLIIRELNQYNMCITPKTRLRLFRTALAYLARKDTETVKLFERLWPGVL
ncbi:MAG: hypothetical protein ACFFDN_17970 [Candidatus Hodarchaeota archaeon]